MPTNKPKSSKKSATARANGAKSHGPATAAVRARSSQNARRHGLAVRDAALPTVSVVLADESIPDFHLLLDSYLDEFAPTSPIEVELVETMASARWRLRRLANIETTLLYNEIETSVDDIHNFFEDADREPDPEDHLAYAFKRLADGASLHLLNRYEGTINRSYAQAFKQLHLLRSLRIRVQPNEPKPAPEFTRGAVRRPGPIPPNKIDDKALPAPPPVLQTPPPSPKIHLESPKTHAETQQIPIPALQMPALPHATCDNGGSPRINDQHLHS
jgi:hypothetical protein